MDQTLNGRAKQLGRHQNFGLETEKTHHVQQHQSGYVRLSRLPGHATLRSAVKYNSLQQKCASRQRHRLLLCSSLNQARIRPNGFGADT